MTCPYCNKEMELGYIDQTDFRGPLKWYPAKREKVLFIMESLNRDVRLTYNGNVKAYRCEDCGKIIIDESTLNT